MRQQKHASHLPPLCVCVCVHVQAALRHSDEKKLCVLQQLQAESQRSITARSKLETLCRELQGHYDTLRVCRWSRRCPSSCCMCCVKWAKWITYLRQMLVVRFHDFWGEFLKKASLSLQNKVQDKATVGTCYSFTIRWSLSAAPLSRKRPFSAAGRMRRRDKRWPATSRRSWRKSRPRSSSTASETTSCATKTPTWPTNWRVSWTSASWGRR